jgi:hypothetical protein
VQKCTAAKDMLPDGLFLLLQLLLRLPPFVVSRPTEGSQPQHDMPAPTLLPHNLTGSRLLRQTNMCQHSLLLTMTQTCTASEAAAHIVCNSSCISFQQTIDSGSECQGDTSKTSSAT